VISKGLFCSIRLKAQGSALIRSSVNLPSKAKNADFTLLAGFPEIKIQNFQYLKNYQVLKFCTVTATIFKLQIQNTTHPKFTFHFEHVCVRF
jgi:hypothetical protein